MDGWMDRSIDQSINQSINQTNEKNANAHEHLCSPQTHTNIYGGINLYRKFNDVLRTLVLALPEDLHNLLEPKSKLVDQAYK